MHQILFDFGTLELFGLSIPLRVYGYGLMLVLGFLSAILLAQWRARRVGENPEVIAVAGIWALLGGIFGARLAYVIENWDSQFSQEKDLLAAMLDITSGGLIYYGGLGLAALLVTLYLLYKRVPLRRYLDVVAVSLMVGLAFGRMGCLVNGCCWGGHCPPDFAVSKEFPLYSTPLVKLDGRDSPYSEGLKGPSPPFADMLEHGHAHVDPRLLLRLPSGRTIVRPPTDLPGPLEGNQLVLLDRPLARTREAFVAAAGEDNLLSHAEWRAELEDPQGLLAGSESWTIASMHDADDNDLLDSTEFLRYVRTRGQMLLQQFDADQDGLLNQAERQRADAFLRADLLTLAAHTHTPTLLPAQLLGVINALLLALILLVFFRLRRREGQVFAVMVVLYPITRFLLELIRSDNPHNLTSLQLTHNQWTSVVTVIAGIGLLVWLQKLPASAGPVLAERLADAEASGPPSNPSNNRSKRK